MKPFLDRLRADYPRLQFVSGSSFSWSPATQQIFYTFEGNSIDNQKNSLLHELSHALLNHVSYSNDYQLIHIEIEAWEYAKNIAKHYNHVISDEHIQVCLDSYRDWLYQRSICPTCGTKSIQSDTPTTYFCFNCRTRWNVTAARFCRPYRQQRSGNKKSPTCVVAVDDF